MSTGWLDSGVGRHYFDRRFSLCRKIIQFAEDSRYEADGETDPRNCRKCMDMRAIAHAAERDMRALGIKGLQEEG